ncbi:serine/threonine-protein kinase PINK1, mitochondrial-like [Diadema setosum]|uniref:serine/threonine-protein kinase PINK1, mitochondrial-like n=1 Tax=Diadema setosum TaxID=31175 RepID=UPI003B3A0E56
MSLRRGLKALVQVAKRRILWAQRQGEQNVRQQRTLGDSTHAQHAKRPHLSPNQAPQDLVLAEKSASLVSRASRYWRSGGGQRLWFTQANGSRSIPLLLGFSAVGFVSGNQENVELEQGDHVGLHHGVDIDTATQLVRTVFRNVGKRPEPSDDVPGPGFFPEAITGYAVSERILAKGSEGVVYAAKLKEGDSPGREDEDGGRGAGPVDFVEEGEGMGEDSQQLGREVSDELAVCGEEECSLAIKMMFNYDVSSTPTEIMSEFRAEQLPLVLLKGQFGNRRSCNAGHPNIIHMYGAFVDKVTVPNRRDALELFDMALPKRLNASGAGADRSMYIIMKRYKSTLRSFLADRGSVSDHVAAVITAQILEGVGHLGALGIFHRDLKSNNILVDFDGCEESPRVVIADFGCAIACTQNQLSQRVQEGDRARQGNIALMAPEVKKAHRQKNICYHDYLKADSWAVGAIIYEICGQKNPFYDGLDGAGYRSHSLPQLQSEHMGLRLVCQLLLESAPCDRPSPYTAANILHLFLWQPPVGGLARLCQSQSSTERELSSWLLKVAMTQLFRSKEMGSSSHLAGVPDGKCEEELLHVFLRRVDAEDLLDAANRVVASFKRTFNFQCCSRDCSAPWETAARLTMWESACLPGLA